MNTNPIYEMIYLRAHVFHLYHSMFGTVSVLKALSVIRLLSQLPNSFNYPSTVSPNRTSVALLQLLFRCTYIIFIHYHSSRVLFGANRLLCLSVKFYPKLFMPIHAISKKNPKTKRVFFAFSHIKGTQVCFQ